MSDTPTCQDLATAACESSRALVGRKPAPTLLARGPLRGVKTLLRSLAVLLVPVVLWPGCGQSPSQSNPPPKESPLPLVEEKGLTAKVTFQDPVRAQRYLRASLAVTRADGLPAEDITLEKMEPWMTVHGHGTVTRQLKWRPAPNSVGVFELEGLYFIMAGPWDLKITLSDRQTGASAQEVKVTLPVEVLP